MMYNLSDEQLTPNRLLRNIIEKNNKAYTYIILGRTGATGKTWLYEGLIQYGFIAFEITESIYNLVNYTDEKNHFVVDELKKQVIIVLNQPLNRVAK